jgi:hypothetical protein
LTEFLVLAYLTRGEVFTCSVHSVSLQLFAHLASCPCLTTLVLVLGLPVRVEVLGRLGRVGGLLGCLALGLGLGELLGRLALGLRLGELLGRLTLDELLAHCVPPSRHALLGLLEILARGELHAA